MERVKLMDDKMDKEIQKRPQWITDWVDIVLVRQTLELVEGTVDSVRSAML